MADLPPPQFRKTKSGDWAVMGPVPTLEAALEAGGQVDVQKKNGDWSKFKVVSLGKAFDVDGVQMCYGYATADDGGSTGGGNSGGGNSGGTGTADFHSGAPAPRSDFPRSDNNVPPPPPRDETEPIPKYTGGPDDEWHEF